MCPSLPVGPEWPLSQSPPYPLDRDVSGAQVAPALLLRPTLGMKTTKFDAFLNHGCGTRIRAAPSQLMGGFIGVTASRLAPAPVENPGIALCAERNVLSSDGILMSMRSGDARSVVPQPK